MRSSFFIMGHGIARGRNLGAVNMRQIAPTLAHILNIHLASAALKSLNAWSDQ